MAWRNRPSGLDAVPRRRPSSSVTLPCLVAVWQGSVVSDREEGVREGLPRRGYRGPLSRKSRLRCLEIRVPEDGPARGSRSGERRCGDKYDVGPAAQRIVGGGE